MTEEQLRNRLVDIDTRFKAEKLRHDQLEAQLDSSDTEIKRLQGEYRVVEQLIREMPSDDKTSKPEEGKKRV